MRLFSTTVIVALSVQIGLSQPWMQMVDEGANFYDIVESAEKYHTNEGRNDKHSYKLFRRWHELHSYHVGKTGELRNFNARNVKALNAAQHLTASQDRSVHGDWSEIGPFDFNAQVAQGGVGRINNITIDPNNSNRLWASSPSGALWRSTDGGNSWTPFSSGLGAIGCSGLVIDHTNSNVMYMLTGDGSRRYTRSIGVLKTIDGGYNWFKTGLEFPLDTAHYMHKIIMHPTNSNILYVCGTRGMWRTDNGGADWTVNLSGGTIFDIEFAPDNPSIVYCSSMRSIWRNTTPTFPTTWTPVYTLSSSARVELAISPSDGDAIYGMLADQNGFSRLVVSGSYGAPGTFLTVSSSPNILGRHSTGLDSSQQIAGGNMEIIVHPQIPSFIYVGGINLWRSNNGGSSWNRLSWHNGTPPNYIHADFLDLVFVGSTLYAANDGGVYKTTDGANTWTDITPGLAVSTFYDFDVVAGNYIGGTQDNGTFESSVNSTTADHIHGGDGFAAAINPSNTNIRFVTSQSNVMRFDGTTVTTETPDGLGEDDFWNAEVDFDVADSDFVYLTSRESLYRGIWNGDSMDWTDLNTEAQLINNIREFCQSESNPGIMFITTQTKILKTTNLSSSTPTWNEIDFPDDHDAKPTDIAIDPLNSNSMWLAFDGYDAGEKIYYSPNGGATWFNESLSLPNVPVYSIQLEPNSPGFGIYVGTEIGVFYKNDYIGDWIFYSTGIPPIKVYDMEVDNNKLYAATFGRGIWSTDLYSCQPVVQLLGSSNPDQTPPTLGKRIYQAGSTLMSSQTITGGVGIDVEYRSGQKIDMSPGFVAKAGVQWKASIQACPD